MLDNINKMDVKQLRNAVQLLYDEFSIMKRKYEDIIYNLDTENFSSRFVKEQGDMKTAIKITAEGIEAKVSKEELDTFKESTITQTANQIKVAVESVNTETDNKLKNYATTEWTTNAISSEVKTLSDADVALSSRITQTSSEIRSVVSKNISVKFESSVKPTYANTTDAEKGMLCEYNDTLYYYNDITETWKVYPYADGIMSQFLQTANGFELTGDVSISGDAIVGGTISGSKLKGGSFLNSAGSVILTLGGSLSSNMGDMTLSTDDGRQVFQVYDDATITDFKVKESAFLASTGITTFAYGAWDFSDAIVTLPGGVGGDGSVVAVFG